MNLQTRQKIVFKILEIVTYLVKECLIEMKEKLMIINMIQITSQFVAARIKAKGALLN